jgi:predicted nucleic-acid-binding Zn-ribbon protein
VNEQARCPKCASSERIRDVLVTAPADGGTVAVEVQVNRHPHALLFKGATKTPLKATVCAQCGFTELYASDPSELLAASRELCSSGEDA